MVTYGGGNQTGDEGGVQWEKGGSTLEGATGLEAQSSAYVRGSGGGKLGRKTPCDAEGSLGEGGGGRGV